MTPLTYPPPVVVFACGEPNRGDDGAALAAAARLTNQLPAGLASIVSIRCCGDFAIDDLLDLPGGVRLVVLDTTVGVAPGSIVVIPLEKLAQRAAPAVPRSSHELPCDQILGLASLLMDDPPEGVFVGLGGLSFGLGEPLSEPVERALPDFVATALAEIQRLAASFSPTSPDVEPALVGASGGA